MGATWAPEVLDLFLELAAIPSPSGEEAPVAKVIGSYLADLGLEQELDEAGNLLTRLEASGNGGGTPIFLCAHMDTVPPLGPIEPVVEAEGLPASEPVRRSSSHRPWTPSRRSARSTPSWTTRGTCATPPARSSAPTTQRPSPSCSRLRGSFSPNAGRTRASSSSSRFERK